MSENMLAPLLDPLNEAQRAAVSSQKPHLLVLAGAGSGKTRVLVHRIAWVLATGVAMPHEILAVTFTNKAAFEMQQRIEDLVERPIGGMWVGTFHRLAHRILRRHAQEAGLSEDFQIIDADDQHRIIRQILKDWGHEEKDFPPKKIQWAINHWKDEGLTPEHVNTQVNSFYEFALTVYSAYEEICNKNNLVDFGGLLLKVLMLWRSNEEILKHYQNKFKVILVDEFQDTNKVQYAWVQNLTAKNTHLVVVGDDDQSIYSWRGAKVENIMRVQHDYPNVEVIRLEQNYRSTETILKAANAVIENNTERMGKSLWTEGNVGEPILLYEAYNENEEAKFIANQISYYMREGQSLNDIAVLYRSNAQSRVIESAFIEAHLPYRIYGGQRFFERAEIKDALAYLRLVVNSNDSPAFERVVNFPPRKIGERSLDELRQIAISQDVSLWEATNDPNLNSRVQNLVTQFTELIQTLALDIDDLSLDEKVQTVISASGLWDYYSEQKSEKAKVRLDNLQELVNAAKDFMLHTDERASLQDFLSHAALESGETQTTDSDEVVQMMTLHAAKGLEFPIVFLSGVEKDVFPREQNFEDQHSLEEERRLCYVGMTRAKNKLCISYALNRFVFGSYQRHGPSRFIAEIPKALLHSPQGMQSPIAAQPSCIASEVINDAPFRAGQRVLHPKFGEGVVMAYRQEGAKGNVNVYFDREGSKWLDLQYARLQAV